MDGIVGKMLLACVGTVVCTWYITSLALTPADDAAVCSTAEYVGEECDAFKKVGNVDGAGKKVETPEILYSSSTTANEEDKGLEAISFRTRENGKPHYYRVVLEHEEAKYVVVSKDDMTEEEAFEDRLVKR